MAETAPAADTSAETPVNPMAEYVDLAKTVAYALAIAFVLRVVLFQPFTIPSGSMEPGLRQGDYIIVSKYSYGWSRYSIPFDPPLFSGRLFFHAPQRGDVIVFKFPADMSKDFIKRLIGLPGDKVQVRQGVVYVNGKAVEQTSLGSEVSETGFIDPEHPEIPTPVRVDRNQVKLGKHTFVSYSRDKEQPVENTGVYTVPQGCYFLMGDNRDNSLDSRFSSGTAQCATDIAEPLINASEAGVGFVPVENLVGKAEIILFSWKPGASLLKPWTWFNVNLGRFFHPLS